MSIPLRGDRAVRDMIYADLHASDIEADAPVYHNPATASSGEAPVWDGSKWVPTDVLTPAEHTAIGDGAPHHAAVSLDTAADDLLSLSAQTLGLAAQTANTVLVGPLAGTAVAPTFRALTAADLPGVVQQLHVWVADDAQNPAMGTLPANSYVLRVHCYVAEAFNSDGADQLTLGYDADPDAFATTIDVSTTGSKTVTLGVEAGYGASSRDVEAYYTNGGTEPTAGKALLLLEYCAVTAPPA